MVNNFQKKDYSHNNTKLIPLHNGVYTKLQLAVRYTAYGDCSYRSSSGKLALKENSISRHFQNASGIPGVVLVTQNGTTFLGYTFGYGMPVVDETHFKDQAMAQALGRFKKQAQEKAILALEYLSERRTLADQLSSICKKMVETARLLKERKFKTIYYRAKRTGERVDSRKEMTVHEKWLAYSFTIQPMIDDLVKNIAGLKELHASKLRKRGYHQEVITDEGSNYINEYVSTLQYSYRVTITGEVTVDDPARATQSLVGLNLGDLYDVVPFSFVLDWLFNVGQVIKGLTVPGLSYSNTSVTILEKRHTEHWGKAVPCPFPSVTYSTWGGSYYESNAHYSRNAGPLPDIPLVWNGGINSLWRAFTSIALARTIFST